MKDITSESSYEVMRNRPGSNTQKRSDICRGENYRSYRWYTLIYHSEQDQSTTKVYKYLYARIQNKLQGYEIGFCICKR